MVATEGSGAQEGTFTIAAAATASGGPALLATYLTTDLFEAAAMIAVNNDLLEMKVAELKDELEARSEPKIGKKAWLRRRLHSAIVRLHLAAMHTADEGV